MRKEDRQNLIPQAPDATIIGCAAGPAGCAVGATVDLVELGLLTAATALAAKKVADKTKELLDNNKEGFDEHQNEGSILSTPNNREDNDKMDVLSTPINDNDKANILSTPAVDYETKDKGFAIDSDLPDSSILYSDSNQIVLGKYPEYIEKSEELGAKIFEIPSTIWNSFSDNEKWEANKKFLDRAIDSNKEIVLSTPVNKDSYNGFYKKEIDYLVNKGFELNNDGTKLIRNNE